MTDTGWVCIGIISGISGCATLERARREHGLRPTALCWAAVAGYMAYRHRDLYAGSEALRLPWCGLVFFALSPVLGLLWWGWDGAIRRILFGVAGFIVLTAVTYLGIGLAFPQQRDALYLAALISAVPFVPFRSIADWIRSWRYARQRRYEDLQHRQQEQAELERKRRSEARQEKLLEQLVEQLKR